MGNGYAFFFQFSMGFAHAVHEVYDLCFRRFEIAVDELGYANDNFNHAGKAATAPPALAQRMIHLNRNNKFPRIVLEQTFDGLLYVANRYDVALANDHGLSFGSVARTRLKAVHPIRFR